jgi:hypothetical protein
MGALGVQQTMKQLRGLGFDPIKLDRQGASNKIWMTKIKRRRFPDVLCVRTGLRVEVRGKSDLKIRMSDAPNNPERTWDAGLRDDDVAAFITIFDGPEGQYAADEAVFFTIRALRDSANKSRLGKPKSASEGAECDRTWPAIIPSRSGTVQFVSSEKLLVEMGGDSNPARSQTYHLAGKSTYVQPGNTFKAGVSILAGAPASLATLAAFLGRTYDPLPDLMSPDSVDRYAAIKALPYRPDLHGQAVPLLEALLTREQDECVALEAAGAAATLGSSTAQNHIETMLWDGGRADLRMEAVLILTELGSAFAKRELTRIASDSRFAGDEIRQAAVWGLGKTGLKVYGELIPFISDSDENVAMHAIVAFGNDTPEAVIRSLIGELIINHQRRSPAASESLRMIGNETVLRALVEAAPSGGDWVLATLGRLPPNLVKPALEGSSLLGQVAPMLLLSEGANWLAKEDRVMDLAFLARQNL